MLYTYVINEVRASVCNPSNFNALSRYGVIFATSRTTELVGSSRAWVGIKVSSFVICPGAAREVPDGGTSMDNASALHDLIDQYQRKISKKEIVEAHSASQTKYATSKPVPFSRSIPSEDTLTSHFRLCPP